MIKISSGGSRIFPGGGRQLPKVLLFFNFFPKTAWKWKNLDPQRGRASLAPPLGSANDQYSLADSYWLVYCKKLKQICSKTAVWLSIHSFTNAATQNSCHGKKTSHFHCQVHLEIYHSKAVLPFNWKTYKYTYSLVLQLQWRIYWKLMKVKAIFSMYLAMKNA